MPINTMCKNQATNFSIQNTVPYLWFKIIKPLVYGYIMKKRNISNIIKGLKTERNENNNVSMSR